MLGKTILVKEVKKALDNGIVCFHSFDEKGENNYSFLTSNLNFIYKNSKLLRSDISSSSEFEDEFDEPFTEDDFNEFNSEYEINNYDILANRNIEKIFLPAFFGETSVIASCKEPKYANYLKAFNLDDYTVNYDFPVYKLCDFSLVEEGDFIRYDNKGRLKNEYLSEYDDESEFIVSNLNKNNFLENDGYLYLGERTGSLFISSEKFNQLSDENSSNYGIVKGEKHRVFKAFSIFLLDNLVDIIVLDLDEVKTNLTISLEPFDDIEEPFDEIDSVEDIDIDSVDDFDDEIDLNSNNSGEL